MLLATALARTVEEGREEELLVAAVSRSALPLVGLVAVGLMLARLGVEQLLAPMVVATGLEVQVAALMQCSAPADLRPRAWGAWGRLGAVVWQVAPWERAQTWPRLAARVASLSMTTCSTTRLAEAPPSAVACRRSPRRAGLNQL